MLKLLFRALNQFRSAKQNTAVQCQAHGDIAHMDKAIERLQQTQGLNLLRTDYLE